MNCDRFEELVLDYIEGNLDNQDSAELIAHKESCSKCTELYDHYISIRNIVETDDLEPDGEVLKNIRDYAGKKVQEKPSTLKKWFYSPVWGPAFGVAIALMVWIYLGDDYINQQTVEITESEEEAASLKTDFNKGTVEDLPSSASIEAGKGLVRDNIGKPSAKAKPGESDQLRALDIEVVDKTEPGRDRFNASDDMDSYKEEEYGYRTGKKEAREDYNMAEQKEFTENEQQPVESPEKKKLAEKDYKQNAPMSSKRSSVGSVGGMEETMQKDPGYYDTKVVEVRLLQYEGQYQKSIDTAQKLLNMEPEPPIQIQNKLFISQAECYEELEKYDEALKIYNKLNSDDPSKSNYYSNKIQELNIKVSK